MVLARKLALLREHLDRAKRRRPNDINELSSDLDRQDALALSVIVIVQEAIDIAFHIVTDEGWGAPASLGDTFTFLRQHGVITTETAEAMQRGTKLRNLIAHAYGDVDPKKLFVAATAGIGQIQRFLAETGAWVTARSGG